MEEDDGLIIEEDGGAIDGGLCFDLGQEDGESNQMAGAEAAVDDRWAAFL